MKAKTSARRRMKEERSPKKKRRAREAEPLTEGVSESTQEKRRARVEHDEVNFGPLPEGATHFAMTQYADNGTSNRCFLPMNGVAVERFPVKLLSVERVRHYWGPGVYKGQWLKKDDRGRWAPAGKTREVRILPNLEGQPVRGSTRVVGTPDFPPASEQVPVSSALPSEVIDARVKAEQEIARIRLEAERDVSRQRLELQEERSAFENEQRMAEFRREITAEIRRELGSTALVRRGHRQDDDEDDDDPEPGPWDWLGPILEKLRPSIEAAAPLVIEKIGKMLAAKGGA